MSTERLDVEAACSLVLGPPGTYVKLTILPQRLAETQASSLPMRFFAGPPNPEP